MTKKIMNIPIPERKLRLTNNPVIKAMVRVPWCRLNVVC